MYNEKTEIIRCGGRCTNVVNCDNYYSMAGTLNAVTMDEVYPERSRGRKFLFPERSRRFTQSEAEGRKNLAHCIRKSGASAPLSDRIFFTLSGVEGLTLLEVEVINFCSLSEAEGRKNLAYCS